MKRADALAKLWGRAWANMKRAHSHNQGLPTQKQCLVCGEVARIEETIFTERVFCGSQCQESLCRLQGPFHLGYKRGAAAIAEARPDFEEMQLTDDDLERVFRLAYQDALYSVEEYEELLAMMTVSKQFYSVIEFQVIPNIRFLCGEVLNSIDQESLLEFRHLEVFAHGKVNTLGGLAYVTMQIDIADWHRFDYLKELHLTNCRFPPSMYMSAYADPDYIFLPRLEILELENVRKITNVFVGFLLNLRKLTIGFCKRLDEGCLPNLTKLRTLKLGDTKNRFKSLNACPGLTALTLDGDVRIAEVGVVELTNLTSLDVTGLNGPSPSPFTAARLLALGTLTTLAFPADDITNETLMRMTQLRKLDATNADIRVEALLQLVNLVSLGVPSSFINDQDLPLDALSAFPNLTELDLTNASVHLGGEDGLQLPVTLKSLAFSSSTTMLKHTLAMLFTLVPFQLERLYLINVKNVDDQDLHPLTSLRVLDLSRTNSVTNDGLRNLVNLTELYLIDNYTITFRAVEGLARLRYLVAIRCRLTHPQITRLRQRGVVVTDGGHVKGVDKWPPHHREGY
jgi:hypothetical protein